MKATDDIDIAVPSVRLSVRAWHCGIMTKRLNVNIDMVKNFHRRIATLF